jgi:hypothetical protein
MTTPLKKISQLFWGICSLLRDKHEDSINPSLEIPTLFASNAIVAKHIVIDPVRLPYYLELNNADIESLMRVAQ